MSERHRAFTGTPELHERHRPRLFAHAYSAISRRICARCCCRCRCYPDRRFVRVFLFTFVTRMFCVECASSFDDKDDEFSSLSLISLFSSSFSFFFAFFSFSFFIRPNPLVCRLFIIIIVSLRILYISVVVVISVVVNMDCGVFLCKMKFMRFFRINFS